MEIIFICVIHYTNQTGSKMLVCLFIPNSFYFQIRSDVANRKGRGFVAQLELDLIRHQQMAGAILKIFNQPLRSGTEHVST